jgi:hypothetical protein
MKTIKILNLKGEYMKDYKKLSLVAVGLVCVMFLGFAVLNGCKKQPPPATGGSSTTLEAKMIYTCPMHPEITSDKPGNCPKCGMALVKKEIAQPAAE